MKTFLITKPNRAVGTKVQAESRAEALKYAKAMHGNARVSVICLG